MCGKKKKSIQDLETELEQLIATSGQSEDNIHNDFNDYCALKRKIDNPNSRHDDDDIRWMKDLHNVFLLGMSICNRQNKTNAACKVIAAAAATATAAAAIATSNVANTSIISSYATSADSSASTLINCNENTASFESTPPPSSDSPSTCHLCPPPMTKPELASTSTLCPTSRLFSLHTPQMKSLPALRPMPPLHCPLHI
jgi:hypothetical protein